MTDNTTPPQAGQTAQSLMRWWCLLGAPLAFAVVLTSIFDPILWPLFMAGLVFTGFALVLASIPGSVTTSQSYDPERK